MMDLSWLITSLLGLIILYCFYYICLNSSDYYWKKRNIPYIKSPPLIGAMIDVLLMRKGIGEFILDSYKKLDGERFGGYFQFTSPVILIRDPELINQILIKDFTHFEDRGPPIKPYDLFSLSMANMTGDEWRNARHKLTPSFTSGKLKMMFGPMKECSDELVNYLEDKINQDIDSRDIMSKVVLNIIATIAFGFKVNTLDGKDEQSVKFYNYSSKFFKPSFSVIIKLLLTMSAPQIRNILKLRVMDEDVEIFFKNLTKDITKQRQASESRRNDFLQLLLDQREKEKFLNAKDFSKTEYQNENDKFEHEDKELMDQLKYIPIESNNSEKSKEVFTDDFIAAQTFIFIAGGSETTAAVLSFVLYELAMNLECQKKVLEEVDKVLSSEKFSYQAISKMTYMEQFINETFRLHPVLAGLFRVCTRDYKVPGTNFVIEKGMFVSIPAIGLHKDPQYFPDPEKFNPDRFENPDSVPKGVYFSFGAGPRFCIAMRLAMLKMKIILASLLKTYSVTLSNRTKLPLKLKKNSFLVNVEGGIWVKFHQREV